MMSLQREQGFLLLESCLMHLMHLMSFHDLFKSERKYTKSPSYHRDTESSFVINEG